MEIGHTKDKCWKLHENLLVDIGEEVDLQLLMPISKNP